jgi:hypothetical protein
MSRHYLESVDIAMVWQLCNVEHILGNVFCAQRCFNPIQPVSNQLGVDLLERQEIFLNQSVIGSENAKEASLW